MAEILYRSQCKQRSVLREGFARPKEQLLCTKMPLKQHVSPKTPLSARPELPGVLSGSQEALMGWPKELE